MKFDLIKPKIHKKWGEVIWKTSWPGDSNHDQTLFQILEDHQHRLFRVQPIFSCIIIPTPSSGDRWVPRSKIHVPQFNLLGFKKVYVTLLILYTNVDIAWTHMKSCFIFKGFQMLWPSPPLDAPFSGHEAGERLGAPQNCHTSWSYYQMVSRE